MGFATVTLVAAAVFIWIPNTDAWGTCPPPSKVYGCTPVCRDNYDCKKGKICCPNSCHTKSCSEPARGGSNDKYPDKNGVYCGNVKCSPYEKCVKDPVTGRLVCRRA